MSGKRRNGEGSIYAYGGRWYVQGTLHGKRRKVSRATQGAARAAWAELVGSTVTALDAADTPQTVAEALDEWLRLKRHRWEYKTVVTYQSIIRRQVIPLLGSRRIADLTARDVDLWLRELIDSGLSTSTVRQARIILKQTADMLVRHGALPVNPVLACPPPPKKKIAVDLLTIDEARAVVTSAPTAQARARLLVGLSLGVRQGELLALTWDHIDLSSANPSMTIVGTLQRQTGRGLVTKPPKTPGSNRTLPLSPVMVDALKASRAEQDRQRLASNGAAGDWSHVFTTTRGTPVDPANDRKQWFKHLERAGIRKVPVHSARHTAATLMLRHGSNLQSVQQTLGHTSIRTTVDIYGHLTTHDGSTATAAVAAALIA